MTEHSTTEEPCDVPSPAPTRDELQAELLEVPQPAAAPKPVEPPSMDQVLNGALRHIRGLRGGDLLAVILVGSGARRALTKHSDIDLIAVIKGEEEREEIIRIGDRLVEIRYRGHKAMEEELPFAPRLPPLLRKGRVLIEHEAVGTKLIEKAGQRFRQGPPPASLNERLGLKAQCLHWLGKAEDLKERSPTAQYLLGIFLEDLLDAYFRLRGLWLTSPADTLRFVASRDSAMGDLLAEFLTASSVQQRLEVGRRLADALFREIPNPPRVD